jgi:hypothetical protein
MHAEPQHALHAPEIVEIAPAGVAGAARKKNDHSAGMAA